MQPCLRWTDLEGGWAASTECSKKCSICPLSWTLMEFNFSFSSKSEQNSFPSLLLTMWVSMSNQCGCEPFLLPHLALTGCEVFHWNTSKNLHTRRTDNWTHGCFLLSWRNILVITLHHVDETDQVCDCVCVCVYVCVCVCCTSDIWLAVLPPAPIITMARAEEMLKGE